MLREEKVNLVQSLKEMLSNSTAVILSHYHGLNMRQITDLRKNMHSQNISFMVVKNTLLKLAIQDTEFSELDQYLTGPVAVSASSDPVAVAKMLANFAKENEQLKLVGAVVDKKTLDVQAIKALSKMPSLDELRAKIIGLLNAPATSLVSVLSAPGTQVARVISLYSQQTTEQ